MQRRLRNACIAEHNGCVTADSPKRRMSVVDVTWLRFIRNIAARHFPLRASARSCESGRHRDPVSALRVIAIAVAAAAADDDDSDGDDGTIGASSLAVDRARSFYNHRATAHLRRFIAG